jgi:hypothetical protein
MRSLFIRCIDTRCTVLYNQNVFDVLLNIRNYQTIAKIINILRQTCTNPHYARVYHQLINRRRSGHLSTLALLHTILVCAGFIRALYKTNTCTTYYIPYKMTQHRNLRNIQLVYKGESNMVQDGPSYLLSTRNYILLSYLLLLLPPASVITRAPPAGARGAVVDCCALLS